jgi:hypothetical protein
VATSPKSCHASCTHLVERIDALSTTVATAVEGIRWIKMAVIGLYSTLGVAVAKTVIASLK